MPPITYYWTIIYAPNLGPLISRREINKFETCWYKSVRILKVLKLLFQQFLNLSSSQRGPILGALSSNRWSWGIKRSVVCFDVHRREYFLFTETFSQYPRFACIRDGDLLPNNDLPREHLLRRHHRLGPVLPGHVLLVHPRRPVDVVRQLVEQRALLRPAPGDDQPGANQRKWRHYRRVVHAVGRERDDERRRDRHDATDDDGGGASRRAEVVRGGILGVSVFLLSS